MKANIRHLANRIKTDRKLLEAHPENKDMLERRLIQNMKLMADHAVNHYAAK